MVSTPGGAIKEGKIKKILLEVKEIGGKGGKGVEKERS